MPARQYLLWYGLFFVVAVFSGQRQIERGEPILESPSVWMTVWWLMEWALTIPHELGHAVMARRVGFPNIRVVIGFGRPIWSGTILGFPWLFKQIPLGGFTLFGEATQASRRDHAMVVAAGPAISLAAMVVTWILFRDEGGWMSFATLPGIFFAANAFVFLQSVVPYYFESTEGRTANDGMLLLQLFFPRRFGFGAKRPNLERRAKWLRIITVVVFGFVTCCLFALAAAVLLLMAPRTSGLQSIILGLFFGGLGIYMARITIRSKNEPFVLSEKEPSRDPVEEGMEQLAACSPALQDSECMQKVNDELVTRPEGSLALADSLLDKHPDDPWILYFKAQWLHRLKLHDEADIALVRAMNGNLPGLARFYLTLIRLYQRVEQGRGDLAERICEEWLASDAPVERKADVIDALVAYHLYTEQLQNLEGLEKWIRRGLAMNANNPSLEAVLGGVLVEQGRFSEAEALLAPRVETGPRRHNQAYALFYLACIRASEGKFGEARKMIERATILEDAEWLQKRAAKKLSEWAAGK